MIRKLIIIMILIFSFQYNCKSSDDSECEKLHELNNTYTIFNLPISEENKEFMTEVKGKKREELIAFGNMLNDLFINNKPDELAGNISFKEFKSYRPGITSKNISELIRKQLINRKGPYYYFFFDKMKLFINEKTFKPDIGERLDVRKYLICYKDKLKWKALYNSKMNAYIVEFSIPDWLMETFGYFSYLVKEENGKYVLIGI